MEWTTDNREWYRTVYLNSEHWKTLRRTKLAEKPACEMCGHKDHLDVHHVNYRNLFDVTTQDLLTVCRRCHEQIHLMVPPEKRMKPGTAEPEKQKTPIREHYLIPVGLRAISILFNNECFICGSALTNQVIRLQLPWAKPNERWRHGVPACQKCANYKLTKSDARRAWDFIALMPEHALPEAFMAAQQERKFDVRDIIRKDRRLADERRLNSEYSDPRLKVFD